MGVVRVGKINEIRDGFCCRLRITLHLIGMICSIFGVVV